MQFLSRTGLAIFLGTLLLAETGFAVLVGWIMVEGKGIGLAAGAWEGFETLPEALMMMLGFRGSPAIIDIAWWLIQIVLFLGLIFWKRAPSDRTNPADTF